MQTFKKILLISSVCVLHGCANYRYPGWEHVTIADSVIYQHCEHINDEDEECNDSLDKCKDWFKKRAIRNNANTVIIELSNHKLSGRYFMCSPELPIYQPIKYKPIGYDKGSNTVTGQGFLTQVGGGVVTCAGQDVKMFPNNEYFNKKNLTPSDFESSKEANKLEKSTQCDATGNFEFNNIPDGQWTIETIVTWKAPVMHNFGNSYYTILEGQGGRLRKDVTVVTGEKNKFIVSR